MSPATWPAIPYGPVIGLRFVSRQSGRGIDAAKPPQCRRSGSQSSGAEQFAEVSLDDLEQVVRQIRSLAAGAEEVVLGEEMTGFLEKLIAGLPGKLRDPLTLSTVEEMSPADVAEVLGVNEAAVRSRLFRARRARRLF